MPLDAMMWKHLELDDQQVRQMIRNGEILLAGNVRLKIYGRLRCFSGKRMKRENRVFFDSEAAAIQVGFRPCGHCMKKVIS